MAQIDPDFPCSLTIHVPFPNNRLARAAITTLSVDPELSQLVQRSFSLVESLPDGNTVVQGNPFKASLITNAAPTEPIQALADSTSAVKLDEVHQDRNDPKKTVLKTEYKATTNRMLRVAVNGFFESLGTVIQVMEELDVDVVHEKGLESLDGAQGVEQGMTGSTG
ncbi:hypothetical protein CLAFUW4_00497 [Fulvia fulva]|uniref:Uncharacterized protein n=1 Tax=Passalora fulva TaxID=5499 RepID=A0A9Q8L569_PASFU|nr:uncharacterized protein CLAFUR5_00497 [Fulvia fulva]KAK4634881.1 hypothetical protein CLAFUR4_00497 [Fulvia fulva]KAK4638461.1 hypothetical protein CLAFUR0_00498 [Fulvia fulva]UJO10944.1 hypothetical protein CLAFUR5_00497 [Fulvia fulva]WPV09623.1 hypothetical protein CLAFUW4_00497 [Fulvia fulva]WPV24942.1 hypothetical protein CLAFUW7_00501 [Fulvia fulva]